MRGKKRGHSYRKRVADINRIYGEHEQSGLSNREIWLRYIYPVYAISERTFYNIIKVPELPAPEEDYPTLFDDNGK